MKSHVLMYTFFNLTYKFIKRRLTNLMAIKRCI